MGHIVNNDMDICCLQETFLKEYDGAYLKEIKEYGYKIRSVPRSDGREHGGLAVLNNHSVTLKIDKSNSNTVYPSFEFTQSTMKTVSGLIRICNIYRPPYSENHRITVKQFITEFKDYLGNIALKPGYSLLLGDFNIHVEKENENYTRQFNDLINEFGFKQIVPITMKTHIADGCLDLIIVTEDFPYTLTNVEVYSHGTDSDHFLVSTSFKCKKKQPAKPIQTSYRNYKSLDIGHFREELQRSDLCNTDMNIIDSDDLAQLYHNQLSSLIDIHRPLINKKEII